MATDRAALFAFYRALLTDQPDIGGVAAVTAGSAEFGRGFTAPAPADHVEALRLARRAHQMAAALYAATVAPQAQEG